MNLSQKDLITISRKTHGYCFYCYSKNVSEIDHFFPNYLHKLWGLKDYMNNDDLDNLFLSCKSCNRKKGVKHPEEFMGNEYMAWSRYFRTNFKVGLSLDKFYTR